MLLGQLLFFLLGELFVTLSDNDRLFFAAATPLATMIFPFATIAMVNVFETFWVTFTIYALLRFVSAGTARRAALLGLAYGVAVLADPILIVMSPGVAFVLLRNRDRRWVGVVTFGVVAAACMVPWLVYNKVNFGSVTITNRVLAGRSVSPDPGLFLGVFDVPRPWRMLEILFWSNRSLFPTQAYLLLCIPGLYFLIRDKGLSRAGWWVLGGALFPYVLFICCFNNWQGGWGYGPRYFMPALMVLVCWSVPIYQRWRFAYVVCVIGS